MGISKIQFNSIHLQKRDLALLRGLFESRVMTAGHVAILYFDSKREYTKKRLQRIKAAGLISSRSQRMNEPAVLFLTRKGFTLLKSEGQLSEYPLLGGNSFEARANVSELTLRHELEIMDVKAAFHATLGKTEKFSVVEFSTWPILHQFEMPHKGHGSDVPVKPDGFISIHEKEDGTKGFAHDFFLEVDRSSKTLDALIAQASRYVEYYKSGGFAVRNGGQRSEFKEFPFRVLMVLKSAERRNNTAERLLQHNPPIFTQVWLTTLAEVTADPLGAVWICPRDYRDALEGTPFTTTLPRERWGYIRQTGRELRVEQKVQKRRILTDDATS